MSFRCTKKRKKKHLLFYFCDLFFYKRKSNHKRSLKDTQKIYKNTLGRGEHAQFTSDKQYILFFQGLSKYISELIGSWNIHQLNIPFLNVIPNEVIPYLNMLCFWVLNKILSNKDGNGVFKIDGSLCKLESIVHELVLNPKNFSTKSTNNNIFSFSG